MSTDAMIEDVVLEEIFYRETPKCQAGHRMENNPPEACTVEVTHRLRCPVAGVQLVCAHTAQAHHQAIVWALAEGSIAWCTTCDGPREDHGMDPV